MSQYFPPYNDSTKNVKVDLDLNLSKYATKDDLKNIMHVDVSSFASKINLAALKAEVDKIEKKIPDISRLATKTSLTAYLQITAFNLKVTELEKKISTNDALTRVVGAKINNIETDLDCFKKSDLTGCNKKTDVANDITMVKNDYATNASVDRKIMI